MKLYWDCIVAGTNGIVVGSIMAVFLTLGILSGKVIIWVWVRIGILKPETPSSHRKD